MHDTRTTQPAGLEGGSSMEMDEEFYEELIETFMLEFEELMTLYRSSLVEIRRPRGDHQQALDNLFRIYHTLKGDAGYFPEFAEFTNFATHYCEILRPRQLELLDNEELMKELSLNYSRLSTALNALNRGRSLQSFRFKIFLRNF